MNVVYHWWLPLVATTWCSGTLWSSTTFPSAAVVSNLQTSRSWDELIVQHCQRWCERGCQRAFGEVFSAATLFFFSAVLAIFGKLRQKQHM